ncbi:unnamed protein product, partial [Mesorhabditis spiculigera]
MSSKTKEVHRTLVKALVLQAGLPLVYSVAVFCYSVEQLQIMHHPVLEYLVFQIVGLVPVFSPFLSLYFVAPYRKAISRGLKNTQSKYYKDVSSVGATATIYITITIFRSKILKALEEGVMSSKTKKFHRTLVKALVLQAGLPLVYSVAVICYSVEQLQIVHHPLLEYLVFQIVGLVPVLSPFLSLYFVGPYRKAIIRVLQWRHAKYTEPSSIAATASGQLQVSTASANVKSPQ